MSWFSWRNIRQNGDQRAAKDQNPARPSTPLAPNDLFLERLLEFKVEFNTLLKKFQQNESIQIHSGLLETFLSLFSSVRTDDLSDLFPEIYFFIFYVTSNVKLEIAELVSLQSPDSPVRPTNDLVSYLIDQKRGLLQLNTLIFIAECPQREDFIKDIKASDLGNALLSSLLWLAKSNTVDTLDMPTMQLFKTALSRIFYIVKKLSAKNLTCAELIESGNFENLFRVSLITKESTSLMMRDEITQLIMEMLEQGVDSGTLEFIISQGILDLIISRLSFYQRCAESPYVGSPVPATPENILEYNKVLRFVLRMMQITETYDVTISVILMSFDLYPKLSTFFLNYTPSRYEDLPEINNTFMIFTDFILKSHGPEDFKPPPLTPSVDIAQSQQSFFSPNSADNPIVSTKESILDPNLQPLSSKEIISPAQTSLTTATLNSQLRLAPSTTKKNQSLCNVKAANVYLYLLSNGINNPNLLTLTLKQLTTIIKHHPNNFKRLCEKKDFVLNNISRLLSWPQASLCEFFGLMTFIIMQLNEDPFSYLKELVDLFPNFASPQAKEIIFFIRSFIGLHKESLGFLVKKGILFHLGSLLSDLYQAIFLDRTSFYLSKVILPPTATKKPQRHYYLLTLVKEELATLNMVLNILEVFLQNKLLQKKDLVILDHVLRLGHFEDVFDVILGFIKVIYAIDTDYMNWVAKKLSSLDFYLDINVFASYKSPVLPTASTNLLSTDKINLVLNSKAKETPFLTESDPEHHMFVDCELKSRLESVFLDHLPQEIRSNLMYVDFLSNLGYLIDLSKTKKQNTVLSHMRSILRFVVELQDCAVGFFFSFYNNGGLQLFLNLAAHVLFLFPSYDSLQTTMALKRAGIEEESGISKLGCLSPFSGIILNAIGDSDLTFLLQGQAVSLIDHLFFLYFKTKLRYTHSFFATGGNHLNPFNYCKVAVNQIPAEDEIKILDVDQQTEKYLNAAYQVLFLLAMSGKLLDTAPRLELVDVLLNFFTIDLFLIPDAAYQRFCSTKDFYQFVLASQHCDLYFVKGANLVLLSSLITADPVRILNVSSFFSKLTVDAQTYTQAYASIQGLSLDPSFLSTLLVLLSKPAKQIQTCILSTLRLGATQVLDLFTGKTNSISWDQDLASSLNYQIMKAVQNFKDEKSIIHALFTFFENLISTNPTDVNLANGLCQKLIAGVSHQISSTEARDTSLVLYTLLKAACTTNLERPAGLLFNALPPNNSNHVDTTEFGAAIPIFPVEKSWPPHNSYSICFWLRIPKASKSHDQTLKYTQIMTIKYSGGQNSSFITVALCSELEFLMISTGGTSEQKSTAHKETSIYAKLSGINMHKWNFIAINHSKGSFRSARVVVFVNGKKICHQKLPYPPRPPISGKLGDLQLQSASTPSTSSSLYGASTGLSTSSSSLQGPSGPGRLCFVSEKLLSDLDEYKAPMILIGNPHFAFSNGAFITSNSKSTDNEHTPNIDKTGRESFLLGSLAIFDEALLINSIWKIYLLGPAYSGAYNASLLSSYTPNQIINILTHSFVKQNIQEDEHTFKQLITYLCHPGPDFSLRLVASVSPIKLQSSKETQRFYVINDIISSNARMLSKADQLPSHLQVSMPLNHLTTDINDIKLPQQEQDSFFCSHTSYPYSIRPYIAPTNASLAHGIALLYHNRVISPSLHCLKQFISLSKIKHLLNDKFYFKGFTEGEFHWHLHNPGLLFGSRIWVKNHISLTKHLESFGGLQPILFCVPKAKTSLELNAILILLFQFVYDSPMNLTLFSANNGPSMLAMLLEDKKDLLNASTLYLLCTLACHGYDPTGMPSEFLKIKLDVEAQLHTKLQKDFLNTATQPGAKEISDNNDPPKKISFTSLPNLLMNDSILDKIIFNWSIWAMPGDIKLLFSLLEWIQQILLSRSNLQHNLRVLKRASTFSHLLYLVSNEKASLLVKREAIELLFLILEHDLDFSYFLKLRSFVALSLNKNFTVKDQIEYESVVSPEETERLSQMIATRNHVLYLFTVLIEKKATDLKTLLHKTFPTDLMVALISSRSHEQTISYSLKILSFLVQNNRYNEQFSRDKAGYKHLQVTFGNISHCKEYDILLFMGLLVNKKDMHLYPMDSDQCKLENLEFIFANTSPGFLGSLFGQPTSSPTPQFAEYRLRGTHEKTFKNKQKDLAVETTFRLYKEIFSPAKAKGDLPKMKNAEALPIILTVVGQMYFNCLSLQLEHQYATNDAKLGDKQLFSAFSDPNLMLESLYISYVERELSKIEKSPRKIRRYASFNSDSQLNNLEGVRKNVFSPTIKPLDQKSPVFAGCDQHDEPEISCGRQFAANTDSANYVPTTHPCTLSSPSKSNLLVQRQKKDKNSNTFEQGYYTFEERDRIIKMYQHRSSLIIGYLTSLLSDSQNRAVFLEHLSEIIGILFPGHRVTELFRSQDLSLEQSSSANTMKSFTNYAASKVVNWWYDKESPGPFSAVRDAVFGKKQVFPRQYDPQVLFDGGLLSQPPKNLGPNDQIIDLHTLSFYSYMHHCFIRKLSQHSIFSRQLTPEEPLDPESAPTPFKESFFNNPLLTTVFNFLHALVLSNLIEDTNSGTLRLILMSTPITTEELRAQFQEAYINSLLAYLELNLMQDPNLLKTLFKTQKSSVCLTQLLSTIQDYLFCGQLAIEHITLAKVYFLLLSSAQSIFPPQIPFSKTYSVEVTLSVQLASLLMKLCPLYKNLLSDSNPLSEASKKGIRFIKMLTENSAPLMNMLTFHKDMLYAITENISESPNDFYHHILGQSKQIYDDELYVASFMATTAQRISPPSSTKDHSSNISQVDQFLGAATDGPKSPVMSFEEANMHSTTLRQSMDGTSDPLNANGALVSPTPSHQESSPHINSKSKARNTISRVVSGPKIEQPSKILNELSDSIHVFTHNLHLMQSCLSKLLQLLFPLFVTKTFQGKLYATQFFLSISNHPAFSPFISMDVTHTSFFHHKLQEYLTDLKMHGDFGEASQKDEHLFKVAEGNHAHVADDEMRESETRQIIIKESLIKIIERLQDHRNIAVLLDNETDVKRALYYYMTDYRQKKITTDFFSDLKQLIHSQTLSIKTIFHFQEEELGIMMLARERQIENRNYFYQKYQSSVLALLGPCGPFVTPTLYDINFPILNNPMNFLDHLNAQKDAKIASLKKYSYYLDDIHGPFHIRKRFILRPAISKLQANNNPLFMQGIHELVSDAEKIGAENPSELAGYVEENTDGSFEALNMNLNETAITSRLSKKASSERIINGAKNRFFSEIITPSSKEQNGLIEDIKMSDFGSELEIMMREIKNKEDLQKTLIDSLLTPESSHPPESNKPLQPTPHDAYSSTSATPVSPRKFILSDKIKNHFKRNQGISKMVLPHEKRTSQNLDRNATDFEEASFDESSVMSETVHNSSPSSPHPCPKLLVKGLERDNVGPLNGDMYAADQNGQEGAKLDFDKPTEDSQSSSYQESLPSLNTDQNLGMAEDGSQPESSVLNVIESIDQNTECFVIQRKLEPEERILSAYNCLKISGIDITHSLLLITNKSVLLLENYCSILDNRLYSGNLIDSASSVSYMHILDVITNNLVDKSRFISFFDSSFVSPSIMMTRQTFPPQATSSADIFAGGTNDLFFNEGMLDIRNAVHKIPLKNVVEVYKRRFLLCESALEIFGSDGKDLLLSFDGNLRDVVLSELREVVKKDQLQAKKAMLADESALMISHQSSGPTNGNFGTGGTVQQSYSRFINILQHLGFSSEDYSKDLLSTNPQRQVLHLTSKRTALGSEKIVSMRTSEPQMTTLSSEDIKIKPCLDKQAPASTSQTDLASPPLLADFDATENSPGDFDSTDDVTILKKRANSHTFMQEQQKQQSLLKALPVASDQVNNIPNLNHLDHTAPSLTPSPVSTSSFGTGDNHIFQTKHVNTSRFGNDLKSATNSWVAGEISNFEYLMWLNITAGRSFNDLTQYPVFPWILKDYTSETLNFDDPGIYRDLSKAMGNQTPARASLYKSRYETWDDPTGHTLPFHYGTHYSSAMIIVYYLVRIEPYTSIFLKLQGGSFDHPERMFHSLKEAWESSSEKVTSDVRELTPEFFYMPEFLKNINGLNLGTRTSGVMLDDVVLPPWCHGDPHEFIRMHLEALESDHVSRHLHLWIDLIFGAKQKGKLAENNLNVFHHLTYEGAVNINKISDPIERRATVEIINNFGQTPRQLFTRLHPARRVLVSQKNSTSNSRGKSGNGNGGGLPIRASGSTFQLYAEAAHLGSLKIYKHPFELGYINCVLSIEDASAHQALEALSLTTQPSDLFLLVPFMQANMDTDTTVYVSPSTYGAIASLSSEPITISKKNNLVIPAFERTYFSWSPEVNRLSVYSLMGQKSSGVTGQVIAQPFYSMENMHGPLCFIRKVAFITEALFLTIATNSSAIKVWQLPSTFMKSPKIYAVKTLVGHTAEVNVVRSCPSWGIFVTGDCHGAVLAWDLIRMVPLFKKSLPRAQNEVDNGLCMANSASIGTNLSTSVQDIYIKNDSGTIYVATTSTITVLSLNGELLLHERLNYTASGGISAVIGTEGPYWNNENLLITGHNDSTIRLWRISFEQSSVDLRIHDTVQNRKMVYVASFHLSDVNFHLKANKTYSKPCWHDQPMVPVTHLLLDKSGKKLYAADLFGNVYLFSLIKPGLQQKQQIPRPNALPANIFFKRHDTYEKECAWCRKADDSNEPSQRLSRVCICCKRSYCVECIIALPDQYFFQQSKCDSYTCLDCIR